MADTKISSLPAITTPVGTDVVAIVNAGSTKKVTADDLLALAPRRKSIVINGNFDVWQRGVSFTNPADSIYTADRWEVTKSDGGGTAPSVNIKRNSVNAPEGSKYVAELEITNIGVADSNRRWRFQQKIENWEQYAGREVKYTIWLESSIAINFTNALITIYDGLTTTTTAISSITTTRTKITVTKTLSGSATALWIQLIFDAGSGTISATGSVYVSQVQLELGSVSTDFEQRFIGEELALCYRYFERQEYDTSDIVCNGARQSGTTFEGMIKYQPKRAQPTITVSGQTDFNQRVAGTITAFTAISFAIHNKAPFDRARFNGTVSAGTTGDGGHARAAVDGAYIDIEAEL